MGGQAFQMCRRVCRSEPGWGGSQSTRGAQGWGAAPRASPTPSQGSELLSGPCRLCPRAHCSQGSRSAQELFASIVTRLESLPSLGHFSAPSRPRSSIELSLRPLLLFNHRFSIPQAGSHTPGASCLAGAWSWLSPLPTNYPLRASVSPSAFGSQGTVCISELGLGLTWVGSAPPAAAPSSSAGCRPHCPTAGGTYALRLNLAGLILRAGPLPAPRTCLARTLAAEWASVCLPLAQTPAHLGWWVWVLAGTNTKRPEIMENARISHPLLQVRSHSNAEPRSCQQAGLPSPVPPRSAPLLGDVVLAVTLPLPVLQLTSPQTSPTDPTSLPLAPTQSRAGAGCPQRTGTSRTRGWGSCREPGDRVYPQREGALQSREACPAAMEQRALFSKGAQGQRAGSEVLRPISPNKLGSRASLPLNWCDHPPLTDGETEVWKREGT